MPRWGWRGALLGLLLWCLPTRAQAQEPVRLVYHLGSGASACPDELQLRAAVLARLDYDPFHPDAGRTVRAVVQLEGDALVARIELIDARGLLEGAREHVSPPGDCHELGRAMALSISIAVDAGRGKEPPEGAESTVELTLPDDPGSSPNVRPHNEVDRPTSEPGPQANGWDIWLGLGGHGSRGALPALAPGVSVSALARKEDLSLGVEARLDIAPAVTAGATGHVQSRLLLSSVVPCLHFDALFLCGVGSLGAFQARARDVTSPGNDSAFYAAVGGRAGALLRLDDWVALRAHADLLGTLTRVSIELDQAQVWRAPAASVAAGIGILVHFP